MSLRGEELVIDGSLMDIPVGGSLTGAHLIRDIEGATSLSLTIYDPLMSLMRSGALTRKAKASKGQQKFDDAAWDRFTAARLTLDGISFRLAGAQFSYSYETRETTVVFEDELATVMRLRTEAMKVSRNEETRAEFIGRLVSGAVKRADLPFTSKGRYFSPQAGQKQPIREPEEEGRVKRFPKGKKFKIKTADATKEQRDNLVIALTEADRLRAGERATVALINAGITESEWVNLTGGDADSSGVLQVQQRTANGITPRTVIDPRTGTPHGSVTHDRAVERGALNPRSIKEVVRLFLLKGFAADTTGAIKYAAAHPDAEPWAIAQAMQGSGTGEASGGEANYGPWSKQAQDILDLWGGAGRLVTVREKFEFRAGGKRNGRTMNWWDDSGDSGETLQWRRFADRNRVWFVPDEWLFERAPTILIDGADGPAGLSEQGIISIETSQVDVGLPQAEIRVKCLLPRWGGPSGATVLLENLGPLDGKWLIGLNDQDLLPATEVSTLTLVRPRPKKKEPAPETVTTRQTETRPETGSIRESIVAVAKKAKKAEANYYYLQKRPMHDSLFEGAVTGNTAGPSRPLGIDCSEFVTLVYKAAGANDPNGAGYNGSGNTSTLRANGTKTSDPHPGDLVHYGSGAAGNASHVAIYIGNGRAIGMGSDPGPLEHDAKYRGDFAGYWRHDLGSGE